MAFRDRYSPAAQAEKINTLAELGKMGFDLDKCNVAQQASKSELLEARAELRRGMNALRDEAKKGINAPTGGRGEDLLAALTGCANLIEDISNQLDMEDAADARIGARGAGGSNDSVLRDQAGDRIGVMLSNADLRDVGKIAGKLGHKESRAFDNAGDGDGDGEAGGLAAFFRGIAGGRTTEAVRASLTEGTDSQGGHAVPSWLLPGILNALVPASAMLQAGAHIGVLQQPGDSFKIAAVNSVPTAAWRNESGTLGESDPTFRAVTVTPRSLAFIFKVSRELLMDAPGIEVALRIAIAQAFAKEIDRAGLIGTGTAPEIRGVLNTTGIKTYDMGTNGAAMTDYGTIIKARRTLADANAPMPNAIITSNREAETIDLFADTTGQPLRRPPALEQLQFLATSQIPTDDDHGTATDAATMYLGDFGLATFYMREQLSIQKLNELYAATGEIGFACHARVDLALAYPSAFCAIKGVIPEA